MDLHLRSAPRAAPRPAGPRQRGAVLLEVVLALALFVAAAAVIGSGLNAALNSVERLRLNAHAADLAVTVMSELQLGMRAVDTAGTEQPFEAPFEDWTWEVQLTPMDDEVGQASNLTRAEVVIRHKAPPLVHRLGQVFPADSVKRGRLGAGTTAATGGTL